MNPISKLSGMPRMKSAFAGWMQSISLNKVTQSIVDGLVVEKISNICFKGVIQPFSAQQLILKPEGERSWQWLKIHSVTGCLDLKTNDKIQYNGIKYKVMSIWDYSLNGFVEYDVVRDYE